MAAHSDVQIDVRRLATLAADQLIHGHSRLAALDIPESVADATDGAIQNRVVFVVRTHVADLPDLLDAIGRPAHHQWLQILLDRRAHKFVASARKCVRSAAIAVESRLIGCNFHDGRVVGATAADLNHGYVFDAWSRHAARSAIHRCLRVLFLWRDSSVSHGALEKTRRPLLRLRALPISTLRGDLA